MSQDRLILYEYGPSRSMRCRWTLRELGLDYDKRQVDLAAGAHRSPEFLRLNPMGRVPVLVDGDLVLTESAAICVYLADKFPEKGLIPAAGTAERGLHDRWLFFTMTELDQPLWRHRRHTLLYPAEQQRPEEAALAAREFREAASIFQQMLQGRPYVLGDRFSVVDIVAGHTLFWAAWSDMLEGLDGLKAWLEALTRRPGCPSSMRR